MDEAGGVGLAANQIGLTRRIFVYDCSHVEEGLRGHIINPVWEAVGSRRRQGPRVACRSRTSPPTLNVSETVKVSGRDVDGNPIAMVASGLMARASSTRRTTLTGAVPQAADA